MAGAFGPPPLIDMCTNVYYTVNRRVLTYTIHYIGRLYPSIKLIIKRKLFELDPPGTENGRGRGWSKCCTHIVVKFFVIFRVRRSTYHITLETLMKIIFNYNFLPSPREVIPFQPKYAS